MPKPTILQVQSSIQDPLLSDNYQLEFPNVPTGANSVPLLMQCQSAQKPGITLTPIEVQVFGHTLEYAGNLTYSHDMTVEYVENRMMQITSILEGWAELIRNHETQHGGYHSEYARDAYMTVFDNKGAIVKKYRIVGCWPTQVPEISFNGSSSTLIMLSTTFKYDWYELMTG